MNNIITYIALGSNLNNPINQLTLALQAISEYPQTTLMQVSSFYQNPPHGPVQPDFINALAQLETKLSPFELLAELHRTERQQGRIRTAQRNGPRTLDLDIILYANQVIQTSELIIPHPRLCERPFVLIPLYEIAPQLVLPDGSALKNYIRNVDYLQLKKIER